MTFPKNQFHGNPDDLCPDCGADNCAIYGNDVLEIGMCLSCRTEIYCQAPIECQDNNDATPK